MARKTTNTLSDALLADVRKSTRLVLGKQPPNVTTPYNNDEPDDWFILVVTAATRDGANWRWTYTLRLLKKTDVAFAGWTQANSVDATGYNLIEKDNGATGVVSGYDLDANASITGILPIATGTPVIAKRMVTTAGTEYWFSMPNMPTIDCETASSGGA